MKKYTLEPEYDFDFLLFGLSCHMKDYRIAWSINHGLELNLVRVENHKVFIRKAAPEPAEFAMFFFEQEENHCQYILVANHCEDGALILDLKHFDYFLIIRGAMFEAEEKQMLQKLRAIAGINLVNELIPDTLKSKNNLIIDI